MDFSSTLIKWYIRNKRDLPWRNTKDPYKIWLSEIILQQTRVAQGMSYYQKFVDNFPTVEDLATAKEDDVLKLWQGLGYYSRAINLHHTAKKIVSDYNGTFPKKFENILELNGIGPYTASAISSFAFDNPVAVVDGNVYRVLSRYFGIHLPINKSQSVKYFADTAQQLLNVKKPALHNQAIMEFGALQCIPVSPDCNICPFVLSCEGFSKNDVKLLPVIEKNQKIQTRFFNYFFIHHKGNTFVHKRDEKDIWKGLYEFPMFESKKKLTISEMKQYSLVKELFDNTTFEIRNVIESPKHILSHQHIFATFFEIHLENKSNLSILNKYEKIKIAELPKMPVPRLIDKFLNRKIDY